MKTAPSSRKKTAVLSCRPRDLETVEAEGVDTPSDCGHDARLQDRRKQARQARAVAELQLHLAAHGGVAPLGFNQGLGLVGLGLGLV